MQGNGQDFQESTRRDAAMPYEAIRGDGTEPPPGHLLAVFALTHGVRVSAVGSRPGCGVTLRQSFRSVS